MRIDTNGLHPTRMGNGMTSDARTRRSTATTASGGADSVTLSPRARLLALVRRALDESPAVRSSVVEAARQRLAAKTDWDGSDVAEAIMQAITENRA